MTHSTFDIIILHTIKSHHFTGKPITYIMDTKHYYKQDWVAFMLQTY